MDAWRMQLQVIKNSLEPYMSEKDIQENKECINSSFMLEEEDDADVASAQL